MSLSKKILSFILCVGILVFFFFTRFYHILTLPIFTDEAIYVRWSQIASNDAAWRFISLTDGKQPMFVWIAMILMKIIADPLFAGRLVSVIAGFFSMVGLFFLTNEVFKNKKIGFLVSFIYILYPFALVYDRLALYDSLVAMFIIWSLYFEVLLARYVRLDLALILGMIIGGGMLTKTNTDFALILLPFSLLLFQWKDKKRYQLLGKWIVFALVTTVVANAMYAILRLSPFYHIIADKNFVFIYQPKEWLQAPFAYLLPNLSPLSDWFVRYMTLPFLVLVASAFLVGKNYFKEKLLLLVWFVIPFVSLAFFGKLLYPRFILFMTMSLLVLGAYALYYLLLFAKKIWIQIIIFIVFFGLFIINDFFILTDFAKAAIPRSDLGQFLSSWTAGGGVRETIAYLKEQAKTKKIYVGTEGTFGLMPYALEMYLKDNPNIVIKAFWPMQDLPPQEVLDASKTMPTYFVFYQACPSCSTIGFAPPQWKVTPVLQIKKLEKDTFYTLYQVQPK